jgi:GH25 family lysozyme M1 (1,4-beta-N-acetylmuramidase)
MKKTVKRTIVLIVLAALVFTYLPVISAAAAISWDGTTPLLRGNSYTISSDVWLRTNVTIPEGAIVTIEDGGRLLLTREMKLTVRGALIIRSGGALEIMNAEADILSTGTILAFGDIRQYTGTTVSIKGGSITVHEGGEYISSSSLLIFASSSLSVAGTLTLTPSNAVIVTGAVEIAAGGTAGFSGTFTVTTSGRLTNSGSLTLFRDAELINGGIFTVNQGAGFRANGTHRNMRGSTFIDRNVVDEHGRSIPPEKMTAAIFADEPQVELRGIDVSHWQFTIDWERVAASGIDFVMIRAARGHISAERPMIEDTRFRQNIEGALANNIAVGVYFYSYARSVEEARTEAEFLVSVIEGYELTYPVVFDIEDPIHERMSMELITAMTEAFFEVLIENGYFPMLYSYKYFLETKIDPRVLDTYAVWLAQWSARPTYERDFQIWQYTDKGRVPGINGDVDLNISYIDFPELLRRHGLNRLSPDSTSS